MKFTCPSCTTAYNLPDKRVAGKVLKIRCRKCGEINTVDGSKIEVPPEDGAASSDSAPETPEVARVETAKIEAGGVVPTLRKGTQLSLKIDPSALAQAGQGRVLGLSPAPDSPGGTGSPSAGDEGGTGAPPSPAVADLPENTRMAIAQAGMAHRKAKQRLYAAIALIVFVGMAAALTLDAMGIITIPVVHNAVVAAKSAVGVETKAEKKPWVSELTEEERAAIRKALLTGNQAEVKRIKARARKRAKKRGIKLDLGDQQFADLSDNVRGSVTAEDLDRRHGSGTQTIDLSKDQADALAGLANRGNIGPTKINVRQNLPDIRMPQRSEGGLSPKQIGKVIAENQGGIQYCATRETKRGIKLPPKLNITVTVVGYGKVTGAHIGNAAYAKSPLGVCLINKAKIWKFPEFTGEPMDIEIPLKFTTVN